jgi:hypothetical protein
MKLKLRLLLLSTCYTCAQSVPAIPPSLSAPFRRVAVDPSTDTDNFPKWERAYFLRYDLSNPTVFAADRSGRVVMRSRINADQFSQTHISDITVSPAGTFAVAFSTLSKSGGPAGFIALLDTSGETTKLVQSSAGVFRVCFADDNTLWALVRDRDDQGNEARGYDLLRHYNADGALIGTAAPRGLFLSTAFPAPSGSLTASRDRIGLYADRTRTWMEISYSGKILGTWKMPDVGADVTRAYLSSANEVYVYSQEHRDGHETISINLFNKSDSTFEKFDTSAIAGADPVLLWGVDGEDLVVGKTSRTPTLMWVKP